MLSPAKEIFSIGEEEIGGERMKKQGSKANNWFAFASCYVHSLVAPVWLGWPTPTLPYDELQKAWTTQILMHLPSFGFPPTEANEPLNLPGDYPATDPHPLPPPSASLQDSPSALRWKALGWEIRPDGTLVPF